jgi:hypothetical protein
MADEHHAQSSCVRGEVTTARGDKRTARIKAANGYSLTSLSARCAHDAEATSQRRRFAMNDGPMPILNSHKVGAT